MEKFMNYHMEQPESESGTNKDLISRILGYPITASYVSRSICMEQCLSKLVFPSSEV